MEIDYSADILNNTALISEQLNDIAVIFEFIQNILVGFMYLFFVVVAFFVAKWLLKNVILKWINYLFRFHI